MSKVLCYMLFLSWAVAVVVATASGTGGRSNYPRTNRGFKNAQLSTARGFGKRDRDAALANLQQQHFNLQQQQQQQQQQQPTPQQLLQQQQQSNLQQQNLEAILTGEPRSSYPTGWLIDELQTNPEMARLIVERFIDENGDGELTPDELFRRVYF